MRHYIMDFFMKGPGFWMIVIMSIGGCLIGLSWWAFYLFTKVFDYLSKEVKPDNIETVEED